MTKDAGEAMAELEAAGRRFDFVRLTRTLTLTLALAVAPNQVRSMADVNWAAKDAERTLTPYP